MSRILAAIDFSDISQRVLDAAVQAAKAHEKGLVLMHVAAPEPEFVGYEVGPECERDARAGHLRDEHRRLQEMAEHCREQGVQTTALLVPGRSADKIVQEADQLDAAMIVIGSHGHGVMHNLLAGSVAEGVLKKTTRPALLIPARQA